jgi:uncharacterized DUF497 family protein
MIDFKWDPMKAARNQAKHGVDFADAATVLMDNQAITIVQPEGSEERFVTIGSDALNRVLVVAFSWRGESVRLISARRATPSERKQYETAS